MSPIGSRETYTRYQIHDTSCLAHRNVVLGLTGMCLSVMFGLKETFMPNGVRMCPTASKTPRTCGSVTIGPLASCWSVGLAWEGLEWHWITSIGKPLKMRCFVSLSLATTDELVASALLWSIVDNSSLVGYGGWGAKSEYLSMCVDFL